MIAEIGKISGPCLVVMGSLVFLRFNCLILSLCCVPFCSNLILSSVEFAAEKKVECSYVTYKLRFITFVE